MPSPGCPSFRTSDHQGTQLAQVFRSRQGRRRLHAAVQPRTVTRLDHRCARVRGPSRLRRLVSQHVGHRAYRDYRRHAQRQQSHFAILYWFGPRFERGFTDLETQLKELYCADDLSLYEKCLICPVGQIDRQAIVNEKANIDLIVATLGLTEITQGTLIRKLCTCTQPNPTRRAIFEFDKLIRSIYTCVTCATPSCNATFIVRRTGSNPTTNYARPSRRSAARKKSPARPTSRLRSATSARG